MATIKIDVEGNAETNLKALEKQIQANTDAIVKQTAASKSEATILETTERAVARAETAYKLLGKARNSSIVQSAERQATALVKQGYEALLDPLGELILKYPRLAHVMQDWGLESVAHRAALKAIGEETISTSVKLTAANVNSILWRSTLTKTFETVAYGGGVLAAFQIQLAAVNTVLANTGKRTDDLGKLTTNLDRIREANKSLATDLTRPLADLSAGFAEWWKTPTPIIERTVKEIDKTVTRSTDQYLENIRQLREAAKFDIFGTRDAKDATDKLEKQRGKEKAGFDAIRNANEELQRRQDARARSAEIASIKTVAGIDAEIQATRRRYAEQAQAGVGDRAAIEAEKDEKKRDQLRKEQFEREKQFSEALVKEIETLEEHRTKIVKEQSDKRDEIAKRSVAERLEFERQLIADIQREHDRRSAEADRALQEIRDSRKKAAEEELKIEKQKAIAFAEWKQEAINDERRKQEQQLAAQKEAAQKAIEIEQQKQQALKQARGEALEKAGVKGEDVLGMGKRFDVLKNLQEQARARAQQQTGEANQELRARADIDPEARAQYARLQRKAQEEAMRSAARDFNLGRTDPQQLAQAQAQAAQKQLGALQQQGKLSGDSVQAMSELIQATAQQQATTQALQRQVDQMAAAAKALNQGAGQQRQAAQRGVLN